MSHARLTKAVLQWASLAVPTILGIPHYMKAIVFDFGNVIAYFDHRIATRRIEAFSKRTGDEILKHIFGSNIEDDYEAGRITSAQFLQRVREFCEVDSSDDVLARIFAEIFWPNHEIVPILASLSQRYRLILGSNTPELHALWFRSQFAQALDYFDDLVLSYRIGARKPSPPFFAQCVRRARSSPAQCVFIDDLPANVAGARKCGLHGIVYKNVPDLRRHLARLGIWT